MKKKILLMLTMVALLVCIFAISVSASDTVPENYVEGDSSYTVYTDAQYTEVITGVMNGTLTNKTIVLGCDIETKCDLVMNVACDITIDLNTYTLKNTYMSNKSGDFDLQHEDAIIRVKNGKMTSTFCMFIFRNLGQVYGENVDIVSKEECFYQYGGHGGAIVLKDCNIDITESYSAISLNNCGLIGDGMLYQIDGGSYDGLCICCAKPGSYVRNCVIYNRELKIDSWHAHGEGSTDVTVEFTNVTSEVKTYLNDKRVDPVFYDSTLGTIDLTGGNQLLVAYTSASCTEAGTKISYTSDTEATGGTRDEQYSIDNPAKGHTADLTNILDMVYSNGFDNKGVYICPCTECDAEAEADAEALFTCLGCSAPEDGRGGIAIGFTVNNEAIAEYTSITGKTLKYGVFAVLQDRLDDNDIFGEDGTPATGVISAEITNYSFVAFDLKVIGFTDTQKDTKLAMGAYVAVTNGETTEYSYMQDGTPNENEKYCFVSYNDVVNSKSTTDDGVA